jgi:subtilisin family serine protease
MGEGNGVELSRTPQRPLEIVQLVPLMELTGGRPEVTVALIDGPVTRGLPALPSDRVRDASGSSSASCTSTGSVACQHGTFVAAMLAANRDLGAPGICPGCSFIARPIFLETYSGTQGIPLATPEELAAAIADCVRGGARIVNLSLAIVRATSRGERELTLALDEAAGRGVLVIAAAGNVATVGSTAITRHPWVIPVGGCDLQGRALVMSSLAASIGQRGLSAPGDGITSFDPSGALVTSGGTSVATPFVTGAAALLWSEFPRASAATIKHALTYPTGTRRRSLVPPLLDAWAAYQFAQAAR